MAQKTRLFSIFYQWVGRRTSRSLIQRQLFADVLQNMSSVKFSKTHRKTPVPDLFLNKVAGSNPATLLKQRLQYRYFVNLAKFLKTLIIGQLWMTVSANHDGLHRTPRTIILSNTKPFKRQHHKMVKHTQTIRRQTFDKLSTIASGHFNIKRKK